VASISGSALRRVLLSIASRLDLRGLTLRGWNTAVFRFFDIQFPCADEGVVLRKQSARS
jgi:hypothetical protein